jgi:DNA-binding response OmpR family regulator
MVVVVDDEHPIRHMIALCLRAAGFAVLTTGEASEAVGLIQQHRPDVLVTDLELPGMDGRQLCEQVEPVRRENPFLTVVITGHDVKDRDWASRRAATVILPKPFRPSALLAEISNYFAPLQATT